MKPRVVVGGVLSSVALLTIGWQLGVQPAVTTPSTGAGSTGTSGTGGTASGTGSTSGSGTSGSGTSGSASSGSGRSGSAASGVSGTYDGATTQTRYGPVQVEIVVTNGTITDVEALQLTDDGGRSVAISNQAAPVLRQEALTAQSSDIQAVSGATYTSDGYTTSLQSAIDTAGL
ncbi:MULTISPECIES: FMN-binding protein [unclassified Curtobacterium]|uniref:FMN-binding protein n=1 Tax=unclassified Curtobacterium TaxID=257496 RepID=UPI00188DA349|nr:MULTISPECIES: FMN-binding protein [unclassified Curtobacterium]MBF4591747.1 FMN-binding protein [Curtobacterium sp. VKM Ac-1395]MCY1692927.1 FMN-binding protein [Curtobacterium sp. SL109]